MRLAQIALRELAGPFRITTLSLEDRANDKEAEEKAKLDAVTLERQSGSLLQGGELHKYNRTQKELAKIKNWQEYCARQHERFEKAAQKTAGPADTKKDADQETPPSSH
jgi:hypothetical protein